MRTIFETKEPNETFAYTIDFSDDLVDDEVISSAEVDDGEETGPDSDFDDTTVTYQVTGGSNGDSLTHNIRITTDAGNVFEANIIWEVLEQPTTFSIVPVTDLRSYLRLDHRDEDVVLSDILREVEATFRQLLGRAIEAEEITETRKAEGKRTKLFLKNFPINTEKDITVVDEDGETVDSDDYTVYADHGYLLHDSQWGTGLYAVTYTGGLDVDTDYTSQILPSLKRGIKLWAADTYYHRDPRAKIERLGDEWIEVEGVAVPKQVAAIITFLRG